MAFLPWLKQKKNNWKKKPAEPAPAARPVSGPVGLRNPAAMPVGRASSDDMTALNMALLTNAAMTHAGAGGHSHQPPTCDPTPSHSHHSGSHDHGSGSWGGSCHDHGSSSSYDSGSSSSYDSGSSSYDSGSGSW